MVASARRKVLPHELQHLLALLDARKTRRLLLPQRRHFLLVELVVSVHVPRSDEQDVAKADLSPLRFRHSFQVIERNGRSGKRIVLPTLRNAPLVVIEQYPAADDPLFAPGADAVHVAARLAFGAVDVVERDAVVEDLLLLVAEVAQAVPLRGRLGVEGPDVVVDDSGGFLVELLVEGLAAEEGQGTLGVEGPVEADAGAGFDLFGGACYDVVG